MLSWSRQSCALSLAAVFVVGGATPVFASDAVEQNPVSSMNLAMAPGVLLPDVSVPPAIPTDAQTRPIDLAIHRDDTGGFAAPAVRRSMYVSFGALQVLDALSTRKALAAGAREANPAMAGVVKSSAALFAVKAGTAVATTFLAERLAKKHPRRATILMAVLNSAYVAVVAHNYRVARAQ
jgi:hypothetical protein